ncbi:chain length determinant protein EpsF [Paucibacter sp. R3-3]|uniref:Chain length determinant protein EpsF n=1 Tax=Roseateles agri TaxID=3098619 RepID=A0ABU5DRG4_9BURK|nr:chain length determinant protein EpsF [Paucibacter sp. R3-3]MDY0748909.1 chain length determinant protein EpsF [Paucibacter sp. R3-3]
MSFAQLLLVLRARWRSALAVLLVVTLLVAGATLVLPNKYTATSSVVLDVKSPDPIAGVVLPGMTVSSYMGTQVEVLQSERVLRKAVDAMGSTRDPALRGQWEAATGGRGDFAAWLAAGIGRNLDVRPGKDSNVVQVSYTARDPELAATIANAVVKGYIETTLELRTEPAKQFSQLFDESTKNLREALEAAQAKLSDFQKRSGIIATDERLDVENNRLAELSTQMVALQGQVDDSRSRDSQARTRGDQMQEVVTNQMVMTLSSQLATQEAKLQELSARYGDAYPQVAELKANIDELRKRLNAERSRIAGSLNVNNSVNQSRLAELRQSLDDQRAKVSRIKLLRDDALVLQRDVENAQKAFDAGFSRKSQSALESQATQTNVSIIRTATPPPFPSSPRTNLNIAVGLLIGLVLGLLTAIVRERRDWRLRLDEDVTDGLRYPLLGVMPDGDKARIGHRTAAWRGALDRVLGRTQLIGS